MGHRTIKWSKRAIESRDRITEWYIGEMGLSSAAAFLKDLYKTAENVAVMPSTGTHDEVCSNEKRKYYSVLIHPKYRLVYRFTSQTVYFVGIRSNTRKTKFT